jgi:hypothetical protein
VIPSGDGPDAARARNGHGGAAPAAEERQEAGTR